MLLAIINATLLIISCTYSFASTKDNHAAYNFVKNTGIGTLAGLSEVVTGRPLDYIKNQRIIGHTLSLKISQLYRGSSAHAFGMVPLCIVQAHIARNLQDIMPSLPAASTAGICSSGVATAVERIIVDQQKTGFGTIKTIVHLTKNYGLSVFFKGLPMMAIRQSTLASGYLSVIPYLSTKTRSYIDNYFLAKATASLVGGTVLSVASQPAEVIRVWQQAGKSNTVRETIRHMKDDQQTGLIRHLFKGGSWRAIRFVAAVFMMSGTYDLFNNEEK